jgi:signal transduction histidine kinase
MTPEVQARVFEPFFTTKGAEGTGLGLANVFATMQRHGGTVSLETAPGKGAAFTLWFPLAEAR